MNWIRDFYRLLGFHSFDNNPNQLYKMRQDVALIFRYNSSGNGT